MLLQNLPMLKLMELKGEGIKPLVQARNPLKPFVISDLHSYTPVT